jgi:hypothetical protein
MPSAREILEMKERRAWMEQQLENENREQYEKYVAQENSANSKVAPAHRVAPASFEEFRRAMPDGEPDPDIRGAVASSVVGLRRLGAFAIDRINNAVLSPEELAALGFDPENRMDIPELLSAPGIAMQFENFAKQDSRCNLKVHFQPMADFLTRNNLYPDSEHIRLIFSHLHLLNLLPEPEPEPEPHPELNSYGVNLGIARDEALEAKLAAQKQREDYGTKKLYRGPDGSEYTQYEIDHVLTADESLRVMRFMEGR